MSKEIERQTLILNDMNTRYYGYTSRNFGSLSLAMSIIFTRCMIKHLKDLKSSGEVLEDANAYVLKCVDARTITPVGDALKLVNAFGMEV